ncbi:MAG: ABC transporter ATP-binding protein [Cyanobacterium sp. T60_A2020_053]|nr:ABC transporter ATP-binding protein [Cyanobacterium sp. T60_A2020_053]
MLEIKNLVKFYGSNRVLDNLNLTVKEGEIYGLLGANGAGKTTTINIICGLLNYDDGIVKINQENLSLKSKYWLGVAPQENLLYSQLSCLENLSFFGKIYGLKGTQLKSAIHASLEGVNLSARGADAVENLSGGMQRRINIAVALVHSPKLLILDEPTTGLDIEARYEIWQLILHLKSQGMTILLTTHLLDEAQKLCDRIGILKQGKIVAEGALDQLRQLVPAQEIILVKTDDEEKAIMMAKKHGFGHRFYAGELAFLLPESMSLENIIRCFDGLTLTSVTKQVVNLDHIYLEVTKN